MVLAGSSHGSFPGTMHSHGGSSFHGDMHSGTFHGDMHMRRGEGCEDTFCEEDPEQRVMDERFAYVGRGRGDYTQVTSMQPVGHGQGEFAKEKVVVRSGLRLRLFCVLSLCFMVLVVLGLLLFYLHDPGPNIGAAEMPCENVFTVESEGMAPASCSSAPLRPRRKRRWSMRSTSPE